MASWYGPGFAGLTTASGEPFDPSDYTAASKTLPFGTRLIVTYNGRSVVVRINDRGPYVAGRDLDLSQAAAEYIGLTAVGAAPVDVTYADPSTPTGPYTGGAVGGNTTGGNTTGSTTGGSTTGNTSAETPAPSNGTSASPQPSAAKDQYAASPRPSAQQYAATPPPPARTPAPAAAVTPPVAQYAPPPPAPSPEALETPPPDLVKPDSTIRQRVVLHLAAPPAGFENLPEKSATTPSTPRPASRTTPQVEQSKAPAAPAAKPQVQAGTRLQASAPVQVKPQVQARTQAEKIVPVQRSSGRQDSVQQKGGSGRGAPGITVLPDTGGAPLGALVFGSLALLSGAALVRRLRR